MTSQSVSVVWQGRGTDLRSLEPNHAEFGHYTKKRPDVLLIEYDFDSDYHQVTLDPDRAIACEVNIGDRIIRDEDGYLRVEHAPDTR